MPKLVLLGWTPTLRHIHRWVRKSWTSSKLAMSSAAVWAGFAKTACPALVMHPSSTSSSMFICTSLQACARTGHCELHEFGIRSGAHPAVNEGMQACNRGRSHRLDIAGIVTIVSSQLTMASPVKGLFADVKERACVESAALRSVASADFGVPSVLPWYQQCCLASVLPWRVLSV